MNRANIVLALMAVLPLGSACVRPPGKEAQAPARAPEQIQPPAEGVAQEGERITAEPVTYLRQVLERASRLEQYRLTFYRQERLGNRLLEMEEIQALYRKQPFSIKFVWTSPDADYFESVYVTGQNGDKLIVRERKSPIPLLPPTVRKIDPALAVKFGRSKNPVSDFGLEQVARRTVTALTDPQLPRNSTVTYEGVVDLEPQGRPAHHIRIERPLTPPLQYTRQDFFVDVETGLPAGTDLYLPGGELDARYRYANVDPNVNLGDADFRLSKDHPN